MTLPISLAERYFSPSPETQPPRRPASAVPEPSPSFAEVLGRLGAELDRGERLVERAAGGVRVDDASALIAIQAGIYRYTETVDLAAKLVDGASNATRTTLQSGS